MADIRGYPNPLAEELAGRLGLHFESVNGKPIWRDGAPAARPGGKTFGRRGR